MATETLPGLRKLQRVIYASLEISIVLTGNSLIVGLPAGSPALSNAQLRPSSPSRISFVPLIYFR
jgi:hypothetical protein